MDEIMEKHWRELSEEVLSRMKEWRLALAPGSPTLTQEEHLVRLAIWMPFDRAGQMLHALTGVQVSEATVRRHTEQLGQVYEDVQNEQSQGTSPKSPPEAGVPEQVVLSADGAFVPLVGGVWAEVCTVAIGEVEPSSSLGHASCFFALLLVRLNLSFLPGSFLWLPDVLPSSSLASTLGSSFFYDRVRKKLTGTLTHASPCIFRYRLLR